MRNGLEIKIKENYEEKERYERLIEKKEEEQREIERTFDKIKQSNEDLDSENKRLVEEMDTIQRSK